MTLQTRFADDDWRSGNVPIPVPLYEQIFAPGRFERHLSVVEALRPVAQRRAGRLGKILRRRLGLARAIRWLAGSVLIALGLRLVFPGKR